MAILVYQELPVHSALSGIAALTALLKVAQEPWESIWYAYLTTGLRKMELAQLHHCDIDAGSREIIVRRAISKNHRARRIPIDDGLWEIFNQGGQNEPKLIFLDHRGKPLAANMIYCHFLDDCKRAGIEVRRENPDGIVEYVTVHSMRDTFATELLERGVNPKTVQELLGHATLEMTMNIYAKVRAGSKRQAIGALSWGKGTTAPDGILEFGHNMPTRSENDAASA